MADCDRPKCPGRKRPRTGFWSASRPPVLCRSITRSCRADTRGLRAPLGSATRASASLRTRRSGPERVYPLAEAGEALRHLIEDRPFGKFVPGLPLLVRNRQAGRRKSGVQPSSARAFSVAMCLLDCAML